ncbi:MAG: hypothetical protein KAU36_00285, partial [candidate division Zixibacteria bacterium]|nr:hypothetical protein [candidate division Zixibacteria bacterium]
MTSVILLLAVLAPPGFCSDRFSVDGYYKSFFVVYELPSISITGMSLDSPPLGSVSSRLRLNCRWKLQRNISFSLSYDLAPRVQDPILFDNPADVAFINPLSYRFDDLDSRLYPSMDDEVSSFAIFQNLDRAFLEIRTSKADFFIGRQAIAFGSARAINPTDILTPYLFETLDTEDRTGIDAFRVRVPLGFMGEVDAGYVFGDNFKFEQSAMFLRTRFHVARSDLSLLAVGFRENLMIGLDITRSVGGAGVWLEGAHTFSGALKSDRSADACDYFRGTLGCDYSLGNNTYGFVEYHFNQAGADDPQEYLGNIVHTAYTDGSVYLLGRHYFIPGVVHQLTPLI